MTLTTPSATSTATLTAIAAPDPYRSLVVGTDYTPCSAAAVAQALRIAAWSNGTVRAVHVIDTTVAIELEAALSDYQRTVRTSLSDAAAAAWRDFAATIPGAAGIPLEIKINNRITGVLEHARAARADLLVLGAFGERRPDVGFGTLATACVRESFTDVLLVRDTHEGPFRTIVAGVDFSETSMKALHRAAQIAMKEGAELHALHLYDAPWNRLHDLASTPMSPAPALRAYRDTVSRTLEAFTSPVAEAYPGIRLRAVCDDAGTARMGIADYAATVGADLTVLGTRGRTNLRDILLGSTAERVLLESRCSVLAVKPAER